MVPDNGFNLYVGDQQMINLQIARLQLRIDNPQAEITFGLPTCHKKFLQPLVAPQAVFLKKKNELHKSLSSVLNITIIDQSPFPIPQGVSPVYRSKSWELWQLEKDRYLLTSPVHFPDRKFIFDNRFTLGSVIDNFSKKFKDGCYPLEYLDIRLFSIWLASFGDLILHASGVEMDGRGYAFLGTSGAGKSTLAAELQKNTAVTVLGEDQVILRYIDGAFWIFGTPWHMTPSMCSPRGVKLEKLFFLNRNQKAGLSTLSPISGMAQILKTAFIPYHFSEDVPLIMDRLSLLSEKVPFHSFSYQLGTDPLPYISGK